ncbi:hypothetical protein M231_01018 [Tremella mesenterica]|uniref:FAS1 domain-containing protein n=1 Tax=Tremella mesenterica TaxID=5217 RepID=A0A4Q1BUI7_TREME|nr:hypothetical protein M231_01018 [Tremella mesenterica]
MISLTHLFIGILPIILAQDPTITTTSSDSTTVIDSTTVSSTQSLTAVITNTASVPVTDPNGVVKSIYDFLPGAGLNITYNLLTQISNTSEGISLLNLVSQGNISFLAPTDQAYQNVSTNITSNSTLLTQLFSYHFLQGVWGPNTTATIPNDTIVRTFLNGSEYHLPGGFSSPIVLSKQPKALLKDVGPFEVIQNSFGLITNEELSGPDLRIFVIDQVLQLPQKVNDTVIPTQPLFNNTNLLDPLIDSEGFTLFLPYHHAVGTMNFSVTELEQVLPNHIINGSVVYSTELLLENFTSAGGEPFLIEQNENGTFVTSGNVTALIVGADWIVSNGVIHVIDHIFLNTDVDQEAAESAYSVNVAQAVSSDVFFVRSVFKWGERGVYSGE